MSYLILSASSPKSEAPVSKAPEQSKPGENSTPPKSSPMLQEQGKKETEGKVDQLKKDSKPENEIDKMGESLKISEAIPEEGEIVADEESEKKESSHSSNGGIKERLSKRTRVQTKQLKYVNCHSCSCHDFVENVMACTSKGCNNYFCLRCLKKWEVMRERVMRR